jgi:hypothetical protein
MSHHQLDSEWVSGMADPWPKLELRFDKPG